MRVRLLDRVALESDLRAGLERQELVLRYQPVVSVARRQPGRSRGTGPLAASRPGACSDPGSSSPWPRRASSIVSIGTWVIEEACAQIRRWREAHSAELGVPVSVNVSARQLSPALVESVATALEQNGVPPAQLALEITESLLIEHTASSREVLAALKRLGVVDRAR